MQIFRLIYINIVLLRHGLDQLVWNTRLFRPLNFLILFFPWRWFKKSQQPTGEAIRLALEELGPIFVKFGQMLSTRKDLLPDDIAFELTKLQDNVPAFDGVLAQSIIEKSLGASINSLFAQFDTKPIASASISQVHAATLHSGQEVVVKVLRPKIRQHIKRDIRLLESFAKLLQHVSIFQRFKPVAVVQEIKQTLHDEIDLLREAASASSLKRNFSGSHLISVPEIYWDYCRKNVLVQERVSGTRISDIDRLKDQNVNLKVLAERGVEIFFTQVFRDCFFHADMHPGNIFVDTTNPESPRYVAVDFGIMGTLNPIDQRYLAENFIAFFKRDYRRVARLHIDSGWVPMNTSLAAFEAAIRTVSEPIFEKPLKDISFAQTLLRLFQVARQFNMEVQPQLLLLQKTLLNVEGLGRQLYPDLDLWHTAKPFLENWMKTQFGPKHLFKEIKQKFPRWANELTDMPEAIHDIVHNLQNYTQSFAPQSMQKIQHKKNITFAAITRLALGCTLLITATLIGLNTLPQATLQHWGLAATLLTAGLGGFCLLKKW
tara:strand:+ start:48536 stop:50170 length:1635 start_codon:yes stop_codon:yes gene_type:complete